MITKNISKSILALSFNNLIKNKNIKNVININFIRNGSQSFKMLKNNYYFSMRFNFSTMNQFSMRFNFSTTNQKNPYRI
jgi:hypothetical protein